MSSGSVEKFLDIENLRFVFVQELIPRRNDAGAVLQFMPQSRYKKSDTAKLNRHGNGPFCKFSISSKWMGRSGVYALLSGNDLLYIGECKDLRSRFNMGYGNISPRNCFEGGQATNCKINARILSLCQNGRKVQLYFHETDEYKRVESILLNKLNPQYNG
jgi:hypothetical protein